jgi:hypothetical protein
MSHETVNTEMEKLARNAGTRTVSSGVADYNIVSDTVTGVNFRLKDNVFQAIFVFLTVIASSIVGAVLPSLNDWNLAWFEGALAGAFAGLILGILTSGTILMVYRAIRHIGGTHD